jgi:hypothetical protein
MMTTLERGQQAQAAKQQLEDLAKQNKAQVVETGWKNQ